MSVLMQDIPWGVMAILLPLIGAMACFLSPRWARQLGLMIALGINTSVAGLGWQVVEHGAQTYAVGGWGAPPADRRQRPSARAT